MRKDPVRRKSDGKIRVWGLGWVTPKVVTIMVIIVLILLVIDFGIL